MLNKEFRIGLEAFSKRILADAERDPLLHWSQTSSIEGARMFLRTAEAHDDVLLQRAFANVFLDVRRASLRLLEAEPKPAAISIEITSQPSGNEMMPFVVRRIGGALIITVRARITAAT